MAADTRATIHLYVIIITTRVITAIVVIYGNGAALTYITFYRAYRFIYRAVFRPPENVLPTLPVRR